MGIASEFGIQPILVLAQGVNFIILLLLLRRFLYRPMIRMLLERRARIAQSMEQARQIEERLAHTEEKCQQLLAQARKEAAVIIQESQKASEELRKKEQARTQEESALLLARARQQIIRDRQQMQEDVRKELARLVVLSTQKVIPRVLTDADRKRLIAHAAAEVARG